PVALEAKIGEVAWIKCKNYRLIAGGFEGITVINYIVYFYFPLPLQLPRVLPWEYWITILLAILIIVPSLTLMLVGMKHAGEETLAPKKEHGMYGGIYEEVRHPQAIGESVMWFPIALILNSPFLVLYSFVWIPVMYLACIAEERDLILRFGQEYLDYRERVGFLIPKRKKD
ncbi:MAG: methyltransferase family protein, partial [Candidatus Hodarchaeota archaeon]